jgi:hypothetical protein
MAFYCLCIRIFSVRIDITWRNQNREIDILVSLPCNDPLQRLAAKKRINQVGTCGFRFFKFGLDPANNSNLTVSEARLLGDKLNEFEKRGGGSSDALRFS